MFVFPVLHDAIVKWLLYFFHNNLQPSISICFIFLFSFLRMPFEISVIKRPQVKKMLGIPDIPPPPPSTNEKPAFTFMEAMKKYSAAQHERSLSPPEQESLSPPEQQSSSLPLPDGETSKAASRRTPSSALSRRLRSLEKEVKGRKRGIRKSSRW